MTIERPMFPPRAESVDSFSLQPAIGQRQPESHPGESRKPAERLSRRVVLAGVVSAATLPIAAAAPAAADPLFDLIEIHRKAHLAHMEALDLQCRFERRYGNGKGGWVSTKACHDEDDAFTALVAEPATTMQGLVAKLAYFGELASEFETEWMIQDRAEAAVIIQSFAASLENIGVRP
jgi:hypothetical protein